MDSLKLKKQLPLLISSILVSLALYSPLAGADSSCAPIFKPSGGRVSFEASRAHAEGIQRLLRQHFSPGQKTYEMVDRFAVEILKTSPKNQAAYIDATIDMYRTLSKRSEVGGQFPTLSPRRLADRLLYLLVRGGNMISAQIKNGQSPAEAYRSYFERINAQSRSHYSASEVFEVLLLVQTLLRTIPESSGLDHLNVGGSFVNGRANMQSSDVDLGGRQEGFTDFFKSPAVEERLNSIFQNQQLPTSLRFEYHKLSDDFFGLNQPVSFRVTRDNIELKLYAPAEKSEANIYRLNLVNHQPIESHVFKFEN